MVAVNSGWLLFTGLQSPRHSVSLILSFSVAYSDISKANA
jgi:hypothetical protein